MSKETVTIKGQVYILPPFNTGQMRRLVDPVLIFGREVAKRIAVVRSNTDASTDEMVEASQDQRKLVNLRADAGMAALQTAYPDLTVEDFETLTPTQTDDLFNRILMVTSMGSNEPGEAPASIQS